MDTIEGHGPVTKPILQNIALVVGMLMTFGGLIWNVATNTARFDAQGAQLNELLQTVSQLRGEVNRVALLDYQLSDARHRIEVLEGRRAR